mgnify:CR=1 FL=1
MPKKGELHESIFLHTRVARKGRERLAISTDYVIIKTDRYELGVFLRPKGVYHHTCTKGKCICVFVPHRFESTAEWENAPSVLYKRR